MVLVFEYSNDLDLEQEVKWKEYELHCQRCYEMLMFELGYDKNPVNEEFVKGSDNEGETNDYNKTSVVNLACHSSQ